MTPPPLDQNPESAPGRTQGELDKRLSAAFPATPSGLRISPESPESKPQNITTLMLRFGAEKVNPVKELSLADPGGPCPEDFFSKSCSFQAILRGKPLF